MSSPLVSVRLIRAFEGPRHDRLRDLWTAIAEYSAPYVRVEWFPNQGALLSHGDAFQRIWIEENSREPQYVLMTEEDFLPRLTRGYRGWTGCSYFQRRKGAPAVLLPYHTRNPGTRKLILHPGLSAGWYIAIDKQTAPRRLRFPGKPDPGNQLLEQFRNCGLHPVMLAALDSYPEHYGIEYPVGWHLFWSRHLHDDPHRRVSGFLLGDVQKRHDRAVDRWIEEQPPRFREILQERFPDAARPTSARAGNHAARSQPA